VVEGVCEAFTRTIVPTTIPLGMLLMSLCWATAPLAGRSSFWFACRSSGQVSLPIRERFLQESERTFLREKIRKCINEIHETHLEKENQGYKLNLK